MSNQKINLLEIFKKLENKTYCIVKLPQSFPEYSIGSDLDIFCYDIQDISKIILLNIQQYITKEFKIEITDNKTQIYIDIIQNDKIYFRFDLYGSLPTYYNINIKEAFFSSVIENTQNISFDNINIKVPSEIDESVLRYIEYQEWYALRPDKIKHIKYLEDRISSQKIDLNQMLDKLHYYTSLPNIKENRLVSSSDSIRYIQYLFVNIKKVLKYIKTNGLKNTIIKIKSKVLK